VIENAAVPQTHADREREIAYEMQQSFLPHTFPDIEGVEVSAIMRPAREVGGDFYDVIPLSGGLLGMIVADVSGKGVPAALYMALGRTLLRAHSLSYTARAQYLSDALESAHVRQLMRSGSHSALGPLGSVRKTNDYLTEHHSEQSMFLTLFYAVYEPQSRLLTYVNAGHNPPFLYNTLTGEQDWLQPTDMVIGILPDCAYEPQARQLNPGDVLTMYSDGVTEAFNADHDMFGEERIVETVQAHKTASAQELLEAVKSAVDTFVSSAPQSDDLTLMVMRCQEN
jgi:sigma-B regulation protein RsbU (phosphoserine phosphatase)